jgi:hypothetical protein
MLFTDDGLGAETRVHQFLLDYVILIVLIEPVYERWLDFYLVCVDTRRNDEVQI